MMGEAKGLTPRPRPERVQAMLDMAKLRGHAASREGVAAIWQKAVESAGDAELAGMSIDGSLRSAYDSGHLAALALLAAHGFRPGGGQGHHEMAFAGAAALGYKALADLVPDSMEVRGLRKGWPSRQQIGEIGAAGAISAAKAPRRTPSPFCPSP